MHYQIYPSLYLNIAKIDVEKPSTVVKPPATNHLVCIDCSGSMCGELPRIREELKKKLPKLLGENDTVSIVWFSGKGQFGTLIEAEPVATLVDLADVNKAIDRWLKPICLTGFKEPLEEVGRLVERISKTRPGTAFSLFFMSDGCDNQWPRADILKAMETAAKGLSATTIVEYGYYADRPLLTAMAEKAGGCLIFADGFSRYQPAFEAAMQRRVQGLKKTEVKINCEATGGFAFALVDEDILTFTVEDGKVFVPEGVERVYSLSSVADGTAYRKEEEPMGALYAAVSLFSTRMRPDVVLPLLKCLGDVHFIQLFGSCFGKQRYSTFMESAKLAAFNEKLRFVDGCDYNAVPADDAFTVLDLLCILTKNDARLLLDDPAFEYNRISRARVDASANLSAEEVAEVAKLSEEIGKTKDPKVLGELAAKLAALTEKKQEALKFVEDKSANPNGYAIANLTYNEDRPNISVLVRKTGTVTLSGRLAEGEFPKIPRTFPTFIFRNYAIVKDGLVNVDKLPCMITPETLKELREAGMPNQPCLAQDGDMLAVVFDLSKLPIINRNMVKACSAKRLFEKEYALLKARAAQKVFNAVKKEKFPRTSEGFEVLYGADAAAWLKEQGFTDYSGFGPKQVQAEATDVYMAKELKVSLKGLSSLPSMNEFKKQAAKGKLNAGAQLMAPCVKALDTFLESDVYKSAKNQDALFEAWLDGEVEAATKEVRRLIADLAQIKFSVVVGQVWPVEFATIEENTLEIEVDGQKILGKIEMREVEQKI